MRRKKANAAGRAAVFCCLIAVLAALCAAASAGTLVLPARTTRIEDRTFYGSKALDEVDLAEPLSYIGHQAFAQSSVRYVYLPKSLTRIEDDAFEGCPNLVCLVEEGSYARRWCEARGVAWRGADYTESISPADGSVTVKNGAKLSSAVRTVPAGAVKRLVWVSSDSNIVSVDQNGEAYGNYPGEARIVVSARDGSATARINVKVQANYRAVLFSESTFSGGVIQRNRGDVRLMKAMLAAVTGPDGGKYQVSSYDDLNATEVYSRIQSQLIAPSRDGDVSLFFFASHGDYKSDDEQHAGRLWCKNKKTWLELPTLADRLSQAKGKVIVLLESCGPGAALHEFSKTAGDDEEDDWTDDPAGTAALTGAFASADPGLTVYRPESVPDTEEADRQLIERFLKGETDLSGTGAARSRFKTEKFIVMTAAAFKQKSYSVGTDTYNLFPKWLTKGAGTGGSMPADTECGDGDGMLTLQELYKYVYKYTIYKQTPQVYPKNSGYVLFLRAK